MEETCQFPSLQRGAKCPVCGYELRLNHRRTPHRVCSEIGPQRAAPKSLAAVETESKQAAAAIAESREPRAESQTNSQSGLGDQLEKLLAGMGITQDRYIAVKEKFGLPSGCGCSARKEWLNKVSDWWRGETKEPT